MWIWPRALPLAEIFGDMWRTDEVRARFLTLTGQWQTRHPDLASGRSNGDRRPGQWLWHPPARRVYDSHAYEGPRGDWLEVVVRLELEGHSPIAPAHCRVGAALSVACRCEEAAHGHHTVVETSWRTAGPTPTLDALTAVFRNTDEWLAGSRLPAWWRIRTGFT